jgi:hypothetical protein
MRKAINENPVVQISLLAGLLLVVAVLMMTRMGSKDEASPATDASAASSSGLDTSAGGAAASPATPTPSGSTATPSTGGSVSPSASVPPDALVPGPGLPQPVVDAWKSGDAIVLLIVRGGAADDRLVRRSTAALSGDPEVSVFVTRAKEIARYSRITQGVGVNRVPALVVVRPRRLSGSVPQAQVSYGFRGSQSVEQAVDDALYSGKDHIPYSPG